MGFKTRVIFVFAVTTVLIGTGIFHFFGLIVNTTHSMPLGIYQIQENSNISKGDLVLFNIEDKKERLIKRVVATKGDLVLVNETGIFVNGTLLENSKIFEFDSIGRSLKMYSINRALNQDEIFTKGDHIQSYDSRYFGAINLKNNKVIKINKFLIWSE
ncbi:S26 family signal peptidase [Aliarcobacter butzleri]|uniref:S26 family signal peptidase n=1 Tax=Aliarcobacter butzleri TaxID=28197 RepID=A0AAW7PZI5_9BACT|nr:S26 family signal peptidase [Aliarcobacter butzleri]MDN5071430.1 S26 family signal peptidase [Aliarcobacter butzleri]